LSAVLYSDNNPGWFQCRLGRLSGSIAGKTIGGPIDARPNQPSCEEPEIPSRTAISSAAQKRPQRRALRPETESAVIAMRSAMSCRLVRGRARTMPPECPMTAPMRRSGLDAAGVEPPSSAPPRGCGSRLGAGAGFGAATVAAGLGPQLWCRTLAATTGAAFLADLALASWLIFFGAAALDFLADFFTDFFADFFAFSLTLRSFLRRFLRGFFFAVTSFSYFLFFCSFFLSHRGLLLPLIHVHRAFNRPLSRGPIISSILAGTAVPIEKLNRVNHRN